MGRRAREAPIEGREAEAPIEGRQGREDVTPRRTMILRRLDGIFSAISVKPCPSDLWHQGTFTIPLAPIAWTSAKHWRFSPGEASRVGASSEEAASPGEMHQGLALIGRGATARIRAEGHPDYLRAWSVSPPTLVMGQGGEEEREICSNMVFYPTIGVGWGHGKALKNDENRLWGAGTP
jgi:hypothetical protein